MKVYTYIIELERDWPEDWDQTIKITSINKIPLDIFQEMIEQVIKGLKEDDNDEYITPQDIFEILNEKYPNCFITPDIEYEHAYTLYIQGEEKNEIDFYTNKKYITTYNVKK